MGSIDALGRLILLIAISCAIAACNLPVALLPTVKPSPVPTGGPESHWQTIEEGLQWRILNPERDELAKFITSCADPNRYRFGAIYQAGQAESLSAGERWNQPASSSMPTSSMQNDLALACR